MMTYLILKEPIAYTGKSHISNYYSENSIVTPNRPNKTAEGDMKNVYT